MGLGSTIGSVAGGAIGTAILPGIGTTLGSKIGGSLGSKVGQKSSGGSSGSGNAAGLGIATGLLQTLQAANLKRKAESAFPELVDPNQSSYLAELNQKRRSIETGADSAEAMQAADTTLASTDDAITRNSGGDTGATLQGLLQAQRVAGDTKNKALATGQQQQFSYDTAYGGMLNQVSGRKMQLQLLRNNQLMAQWAQKQQTANQNLGAGAARALSGLAPASGTSASASDMVAPATSSLAGQPAVSNTIMQGVPAETVVPEQNMVTQGLGSILSLGGK